MSTIKYKKGDNFQALPIGQKVVFSNGVEAVVDMWKKGPRKGQKKFRVTKGKNAAYMKRIAAKRR